MLSEYQEKIIFTSLPDLSTSVKRFIFIIFTGINKGTC